MEGILNHYASECSELAATLTRVTGGGAGVGGGLASKVGGFSTPAALFCVFRKLSQKKRWGCDF